MAAASARKCLEHVRQFAARGDAQSVLAAIDKFGSENWMMNVGEVKGAVVETEIEKAKPKVMAEIGAYAGYSAVRFANKLREVVGPEAHYYSFEFSPEFAGIATEVIEIAGLSEYVTIIVGSFAETHPKLKEIGIEHVDLFFIDHKKDLYLSDLKLIENSGLLRKGSVLVADNVICPGAPDYLEYVRNHPQFTSVFHDSFLEYSTTQKDGLELFAEWHEPSTKRLVSLNQSEPDVEDWIWMVEVESFPLVEINMSHSGRNTVLHMNELCRFLTTPPQCWLGWQLASQRPAFAPDKIGINLQFSSCKLTPEYLELIQGMLSYVYASPWRQQMATTHLLHVAALLRNNHRVSRIESVRLCKVLRAKASTEELQVMRSLMAVAFEGRLFAGTSAPYQQQGGGLRRFDLSGSPLGAQGVAAFCSALRYGCQVESLTIESALKKLDRADREQCWRWLGAHQDPEIIPAILKHCINLEHLAVTGSELDDDDVVLIVSALDGPLGRKLLSLDISGSGFSEETIDNIAGALSNPKQPPVLQELSMVAGTHFVHQGYTSLYQALSANKTLRYLRLRHPDDDLQLIQLHHADDSSEDEGEYEHGYEGAEADAPTLMLDERSDSPTQESARAAEMACKGIERDFQGEWFSCTLPMREKLAFLSVIQHESSAAKPQSMLDALMVSFIFKFATGKARRRIFWRQQEQW